MDLLQGAYPLPGVSYDDAAWAMGAIGVMATGTWIGIAGAGWSLPKSVLVVARQPLNNTTLFCAVWIAFFLGMFNFAFTSDFDVAKMIEALGECRFCAPWSRGAFGGAEAFIEHLQYFGYVLPSLTVLIAQREGWSRPRTILASILSIIMIAFLAQQGGRRIIGMVGGAALITWMLLQGGIKMKVLIGGIIGVVVLLVGMEQMLRHRDLGFSVVTDDFQEQAVLVRVDDNFLRLSQIVELIPDVQPYVGLQPLLYALTKPIPRVLWPGKPSDSGYDLTALLGWRGVSLTTSMVGELYAMNGLFVVFLGGLVYGRVANMWNKILGLQAGAGKCMIYALGVMALFVGLRSMQDLVIMSYGLLGWLVIGRLLPGAKSRAIARTT
jgi:hypothetical protein